MFEKAIAIAEQYTRPLMAISRKFDSDIITQESATIFFVNEFGCAITTAEVIHRLFPIKPYEEQYRIFQTQMQRQGADLDQLKTRFRDNNPEGIVDMKTMFLNCASILSKVRCQVHPKYNLGLIFLEDAVDFQYTGYAKFEKSFSNFTKGKELVRLGYPFPISSNYRYDAATAQLDWDMNREFVIESFPLNGMVTRQFFDDGQPAIIEVNSAGYKGHEGSPLFTAEGVVCGIHYGNIHPDINNPGLNLGCCHPSGIITRFLSDCGVKYYVMENGNEVVYNEKSRGFYPQQLVPTFFMGASDESSMQVYETKLIIGDKVVVDYKNPLQVGVGKVDEHSRTKGSALVQFSVDGQSNIFITEENAGTVRHLENTEHYTLNVSKKETKSPKFKLRTSVKTQSRFPFNYFDILIIRRHQSRDHAKDPHIAFYPDASGKYIRYDNEKDISVVTKKVIPRGEGKLIPEQCTIQSEEFDIEIFYAVNENTLTITDLNIVDKF